MCRVRTRMFLVAVWHAPVINTSYCDVTDFWQYMITLKFAWYMKYCKIHDMNLCLRSLVLFLFLYSLLSLLNPFFVHRWHSLVTGPSIFLKVKVIDHLNSESIFMKNNQVFQLLQTEIFGGTMAAIWWLDCHSIKIQSINLCGNK